MSHIWPRIYKIFTCLIDQWKTRQCWVYKTGFSDFNMTALYSNVDIALLTPPIDNGVSPTTVDSASPPAISSASWDDHVSITIWRREAAVLLAIQVDWVPMRIGTCFSLNLVPLSYNWSLNLQVRHTPLTTTVLGWGFGFGRPAFIELSVRGTCKWSD